jgi:hypothetical protein
MAALALAATAMLACGGEDEPPATSELAGTWTATNSEYASSTGLGTVDIIAAGGATTLVLREDNTFSYTVTLPGEAPSTSTGTYEVSGVDELVITPGGGNNPFFPWEFSLSGSTLHLEANTGNWLPWYGYDFDGDGAGDSARWSADFAK